MINRILLFFIPIIIFSTGFSDEHMVNYENVAHALTKQAGERIEAKYGLSPMGIGGGINDKVRKLSLSVQSHSNLSIEMARPIIVDLVNEYLKVINNDLVIRPYLDCYPFTTNNVEINIFIETPEERESHIGKLIVVTAFKGKIRYKVLKGKYQRETVLEESFEEAVRIVKEGK